MQVKICEIDLSKPIEPIYVDPRFDQLFLIVTWGYMPLGLAQLQCRAEDRLYSADQLEGEALRTVGWQLWEKALTGRLDGIDLLEKKSMPPISVVVCTRDRALSLERCLGSLAHVAYPHYEVLVVDNGSGDEVIKDEAVKKVVSRSGFRYIREKRQGLDWARNRGIREAKYNLIAFVDDDALAAPGWLLGVALGFSEPEVMAVTGLVLPAEIETTAQNDFESYGGMGKGFNPFTVRRDDLSPGALLWASGWGVGTNMAFRRTLFEAIGNFDVALDVGTPTCGGGDIEFFYRTIAAGYTLQYEPAAMVRHVHRRDSASLQRQIYNNGRSFPAYLMTIARREPNQRSAVAWFMLRHWAWGWLFRRYLVSLIKRDSRTRHYSMLEIQGAISSLRAYRQSRRLAERLISETA